MIEAVREQLRSGKLTEAAQSCRQILDTTPDHPEGMYLAGLVSSALGRYAEAVRYMRKAVAAEPGRALWHYNFATVCIASHCWQEAYDQYQQAIELGYDAFACKAGFALALVGLGDFPAARDLCRELDGAGRANKLVLHTLGRAYSNLNCFAEAEAAWGRCLQLDGGYPAAHESLAELARKQHRHTLFVRHAEAAVEGRPTATNIAHLASAYWFCGRLEESLSGYEHALRQSGRGSSSRC